MWSLRTPYMLSLLVVAMATTGCQSLGINEPNSFFVGRYTQYVLGDIPNQYADLSNPLPASSENISDGKKLYQAQCPVCHGAFGEGDGPAGKLLVPSPANLAVTRRLPVATDAFIFWTLSEGGEAFGTAMPAFGNQLTDKEIWQIALYLNTGFSL
ncbi:MAG: hypothetical protein DIZ78_09295 [endosymbiont of Escarpia spicata]|uniref:Cytochrome c domain-containing protein n=1 Tax=endosymbiont of Escarpia spicata TaxID=2200908 RepID=A0A370DQD1_9GAMM|nr:MAG: hypothetical protein DIZ78_09295 [endosymbiont of Escarpia spicata]